MYTHVYVCMYIHKLCMFVYVWYLCMCMFSCWCFVTVYTYVVLGIVTESMIKKEGRTGHVKEDKVAAVTMVHAYGGMESQQKNEQCP